MNLLCVRVVDLVARYRIVLFFQLILALFILVLPPAQNPDANLYYAVSLRILSGRFESSIEGIVGPLLSWLMVVPAFFGTSLPHAFLIVQFVSFFLLLVSIFRILKLLDYSEKLTALIFIPIVCHVGIISVSVVTSDLLFASIVLTALAIRLYGHEFKFRWVMLGLFSGLGFLSRAAGFPIFLAWMTGEILRSLVSRDFRLAAKLVLACGVFFIVTMPWVYCLTKTYGVFNIGTNAFFSSGLVRVDEYYIDYPLKEKIQEIQDNPALEKQGVFTALNQRAVSFYYIFHSINWLLTIDSQIVGGPLALFSIALGFILSAYKILKSKFKYEQYLILLRYCMIYFIVYAAIGGHRIRYYMGIAPIVSTFILAALDSCTSAQLSMRLMSFTRFLSCAFLVVVCIPSLLYNVGPRPRMEMGKRLSKIPEFNTQSGPVAGNYWDEAAGYAAILDRREYLYAIRPELKETAEQIDGQLNARNIQQIVWVGPKLPALDRLVTFRSVDCGIGHGEGLSCTLYTRKS